MPYEKEPWEEEISEEERVKQFQELKKVLLENGEFDQAMLMSLSAKYSKDMVAKALLEIEEESSLKEKESGME